MAAWLDGTDALEGRSWPDASQVVTASGPVRRAQGWVGIAANANAGLGRGRQKVDRLVRALTVRGLASRVAWSLVERSALIEQSRSDPLCRCLVAVGGDGTVADLVNARPRVPVTVLPAGTENLFAQHFGLRSRPERLADTILAGQSLTLDLGRAGDRRFSLMAGFGFDADVVTRHHVARVGTLGRVRRTHRAAYIAPVLKASWSYRFPPLSVQVLDPGAEETLTGTSIFLFNLPRYALGLPFAPTASGHDGLLDLIVFQEPGSLRALHYLWLVFRRLHLRRKGVFHRRIRNAVIATEATVPVQLDGDPGGWVAPEQPWSIESLPATVTVLVPPGHHVARL